MSLRKSGYTMPQSKPSVLFVCLGNICRSPLAEGIFRHQVGMAGYAQQFHADSTGTGAWHAGEPPHPNSIAVAAQNGIDISGQRARQILREDLDRFDLIVGMDASNVANIRQLGTGRAEILRFLDHGDVPDPWGRGMDQYHAVFELIGQAMPNLINRLIRARKLAD